VFCIGLTIDENMRYNDMDHDNYQEKIQKLYADFPLCFPVPPYCGFSAGLGWFDIIRELCTEIEKILSALPNKDHNFQVAQIKEKFGGLRFYVDFTLDDDLYDKIHALINIAEDKCGKTCEACGAPGILRKDGWMRTLCDDCENDRIHQRKLDHRNSIINNRAKTIFGGDWISWYELSQEEKDSLMKKAEAQLLDESKIQPVNEY
jgi:hypothetical protein